MLVVFDKIANSLSKLEDVLIHCGPRRSQQFLSYGYIYSLSHGDIAHCDLMPQDLKRKNMENFNTKYWSLIFMHEMLLTRTARIYCFYETT